MHYLTSRSVCSLIYRSHRNIFQIHTLYSRRSGCPSKGICVKLGQRVINRLPQETNIMFTRFLRKLKQHLAPSLTAHPLMPTLKVSSRIANEFDVQHHMPAEPNIEEKILKSVTVVCACIMRQGDQQVLMPLRDAPGVPGLHGKWELPGGKIEFGEAPEQTIVREIREELGIKVIPRR